MRLWSEAPAPQPDTSGCAQGGAWISHRLRQLEDENGKLKRLLADSMLDNAILKDLLGKG